MNTSETLLTRPTRPMPADTAPRPGHGDASVTELLRTVSLYLHIPFCTAKCHYCDFNSYAGMMRWREEYVDALAAEIALAGEQVRLPDGSPRRCRTIFFGGGTPSLLEPSQIGRLLDTARAAFVLDADAEITMEANPGSAELGRLDAVRAVGVNRLSMGAQSFDAGILRWMGRIHSPEEIEEAFTAARTTGFDNINLDFIFALPGQSLATWAETLERAIALGPEHLSLYSLIVEEGTPLFRWVEQGRVRPADEDTSADMYEHAQARLAQAGYQQYEISNWARAGRACQHNLTYWRNLPYLGLGAGAHSSYADHRYAEARPIRTYISRVREAAPGQLSLPAAAVVEDEEMRPDLAMAETVILGLRLNEGVSLTAFAERFGRRAGTVFGAQVAELTELGLVEIVADSLRLTARGRMVGNEVFARFLPEAEDGR